MNTLAQQLVETCQLFGERQWCLATGGNFSARLDAQSCLITRSGCDKSKLVVADLIQCTFDGIVINSDYKSSAETALHTRLYQLDSSIGAVLHTHSVNATVLSRLVNEQVEISGYEMQKALHGNSSHEPTILVPVFNNTQDIPELAERVSERFIAGELTQPGLLVRGHGLYAWGRDITEARRHIEGFEFLFACLMQKERLSRV